MQQNNPSGGSGHGLASAVAASLRGAAQSLRTVNYRLWAAVMATMLLPAIYQTVRIFFLGSLPDTWSFSIASQNQYVGLFYEVIQEALILPLYFVLGKSLGSREEFAAKLRAGLAITAAAYALLSAVLMATARPLVVFMAQQPELVDATVTYIRLETVASLFATLWRFMLVALVSLGRDRIMYAALALQMALSVLLDSLLVSTLPFSLQLGVNGIAVTNIIVNLLMVALSAALLAREGISLARPRGAARADLRWVREWLSVGKYSGLESLVRNLAFMLMVVRLVNLVAEQGTYWVANNFIWNWLLLPGLALADVVKKEVGESLENVRTKTAGYLALTAILCLLWLASIPLWRPFLQHVMNTDDWQLVLRIVLIQTPFYLIFLFNNGVLDSTFYGAGRLDYLFVQSLLINGLYYGGLFVLYLAGLFRPGLTGICLMFGFGMALDLIPTLLQYRRFLREHRLSA